MLIMTSTTTLTIPSPPRPPHPRLQCPPKHQQSQQQRRAGCNNVTTAAVKCHRNFLTGGGGTIDCEGPQDIIKDTNVATIPLVTTNEEEENCGTNNTTPKKPNWVLSDNFYLLESPKTWRDKHKAAASRRQLNMAGVLDVPCSVAHLPLNEQLNKQLPKSSTRNKEPRYESPADCKRQSKSFGSSEINSIGLHRSCRNLLDFREGGTSVSSVLM